MSGGDGTLTVATASTITAKGHDQVSLDIGSGEDSVGLVTIIGAT